jgi:hypothetical protein
MAGIRRQDFIAAAGSTAVAWPIAARAQKRTALIGLLGSGSAQSSGIFVDSLRGGTRLCPQLITLRQTNSCLMVPGMKSAGGVSRYSCKASQAQMPPYGLR